MSLDVTYNGRGDNREEGFRMKGNVESEERES